MQGQTNNQIQKKILASKKYKMLYPKTVERVVKNCLERYPTNETKKQARNLLHQIWGAYFPARPSFEKLSKQFKQNFGITNDIKKTLLPLLNLQSSIKERIPILNEFYQEIFAITGQPKTIIDWACGLNPLSWPWMNLPINCHYLGFDIDKEQNDFLNGVFKIAELKQFEMKLNDILIDDTPSADIIFLLKLLPLLEHQQKGVSLKILNNLPAKFLVVSFPVHSIGGKQKNMIDFYDKWFHDLIRNELWQIRKIIFPIELIFVIKKQ